MGAGHSIRPEGLSYRYTLLPRVSIGNPVLKTRHFMLRRSYAKVSLKKRGAGGICESPACSARAKQMSLASPLLCPYILSFFLKETARGKAGESESTSWRPGATPPPPPQLDSRLTPR